ncbi:hypothetical protein E4T56_gene18668 [Termitomyces sp. T112]|nr:hypothetical protein E4T56_gene18668 [Termitomyces sp. T112]
MGNAASNAGGGQRPRQEKQQGSSSPSPSPGNPHPSLRTKKKSLELPDLASLTLSSTRGRQASMPPKSASIPIPAGPAAAGEAGRTRAPIALPSTTDVQLLEQPAAHLPFPPPSRAERHRSRSRRMQELYDQSHQPPQQQPRLPFVPETVTSALPIGLSHVHHPPELVPVTITWRGGPAKSICLARAGDDDWKGRLAMTPDATGYHATVNLPPGTHHFRFLVDDTWRVADDLPTAVDDQGTLANYVAVPSTYSPPSTASPVLNKRPGQSFWSAASDDDPASAHEPTPTSPSPHAQPVWTNLLPPELIEAAREEEAYLAASEGHTGSATQTHRISGFVPAPNIPPAPGLPRHLDKLILNARAVVQGGAVVGSGAVPVRKGPSSSGRKVRDKERDRRDGWRDRDRERRERERDRRIPPPAPPPSEVDVEPDTVPAAADTHTPVPTSPASPASPVIPPTRPLTISLPADDSPIPLTDDASVLPVPSHVVLHHLSTSAIRNGVLAVGTTTRYREKYLTSIYYMAT